MSTTSCQPIIDCGHYLFLHNGKLWIFRGQLLYCSNKGNAVNLL